MRLLRERIETLADPLDPGFGFDAVLLSVPRTAPCARSRPRWRAPRTAKTPSPR
jgi:protein ImuB